MYLAFQDCFDVAHQVNAMLWFFFCESLVVGSSADFFPALTFDSGSVQFTSK